MESTCEHQRTKSELVQRLKGGVVAGVATPEQARVAQDAGAAAVIVHGSSSHDVVRMPTPELMCAVKEVIDLPVFASCRTGQLAEVQILQCLGADGMVEADSPISESACIWKHDFEVPFVCEASDLTNALLRIGEGAAMLCIRGEVGTGNIATTIKQIQLLRKQLHVLRNAPDEGLIHYASITGASLELIEDVKEQGCLPVPLFASGGISTPADAALMRKLGMQGVFVETDIFQMTRPHKRLAAIVRATRFPDCIDFIAELSRGL